MNRCQSSGVFMFDQTRSGTLLASILWMRGSVAKPRRDRLFRDKCSWTRSVADLFRAQGRGSTWPLRSPMTPSDSRWSTNHWRSLRSTRTMSTAMTTITSVAACSSAVAMPRRGPSAGSLSVASRSNRSEPGGRSFPIPVISSVGPARRVVRVETAGSACRRSAATTSASPCAIQSRRRERLALLDRDEVVPLGAILSQDDTMPRRRRHGFALDFHHSTTADRDPRASCDRSWVWRSRRPVSGDDELVR